MERKKIERLSCRVTSDEKEMIVKKAEKMNMTISSLIVNSVEKQININLNTSDYRELVIQFRRIGNNINSIIRDIRFNNFISDSQLEEISNHLKGLERTLENERKQINTVKRSLEELSPQQLKKELEKENKRIPNYLIFENIEEHIALQLRSFIDLVNDSELDESYPSYIDYFLKQFVPSDYEYDELVDFSNAIDEKLYTVNQKLSARNIGLEEEDFMSILTIINEYRKARDD